MRNRLANAKNPYQGSARKVLCVCSAGLLRSPTIANVLAGSQFGFNTRAVGINTDFALIPIDEVLVHWADEIIVTDRWMVDAIFDRFPGFDGPVVNFDLPDDFDFMAPKLVELIIERATYEYLTP